MIVKEKIGEVNYLDLRICDNLELMAEMQDNTVDLIYCDILYGTGKKLKNYQDLKPIRSKIESHYIPRIKEMHRILKPTGSIYLQMDTRINHWIRCIMDDIFGYDKFRNEISWWYKRWSNISFGFQKMHDVILFYSKDKSVFNIQYQSYAKPDEIEDTLRGVVNGKLVRLKNKDGSYKKRKTENKGVSLHDVWEIQHIQPTAKERLGYDTQKPKALIERIIKASSDEGDLVADFYAGSFTTADVCKDLNRSFIGCDINPNCFEKAKERGLFSFTDKHTKAD
jgi:site-specific DNA-methyltransferase (adenine-specific)